MYLAVVKLFAANVPSQVMIADHKRAVRAFITNNVNE